VSFFEGEQFLVDLAEVAVIEKGHRFGRYSGIVITLRSGKEIPLEEGHVDEQKFLLEWGVFLEGVR